MALTHHLLCKLDKYCPSASLAPAASWPCSEIRAETSEELLELKSVFAKSRTWPFYTMVGLVYTAYRGCLEERYPISHSSCYDVWHRGLPVPAALALYVQPLR